MRQIFDLVAWLWGGNRAKQGVGWFQGANTDADGTGDCVSTHWAQILTCNNFALRQLDYEKGDFGEI